MAVDLEKVLETRGKTHGPFQVQFRIAQELKQKCLLVAPDNVVSSSLERDEYNDLLPVAQETMDMIATKQSRLVAGDPLERDAWLDIAGYATLMVKAIDLLKAEKDYTF